jgi:hypothetical protein
MLPEAELGNFGAVRTETCSLLLDSLPAYCDHAPGVRDAVADIKFPVLVVRPRLGKPAIRQAAGRSALHQ